MSDPVTPTGVPVALTPVPEPLVRGNRGVVIAALGVAALSLCLAAATVWWTQARMHDLELQLARRIGEFDASARETRSAANAVRASSEDMQTRVAALEARAQDAQSQQLALAAMYQELARSQDQRLVTDIEQGLLMVQQQLQLSGSPQAAIAGLEALGARLAAVRKPQFTPLREAVARDAARLRLLPAADVTGIGMRLDAMIQRVESLRLESDPDARPSEPGRGASAPGWLARWRADAWTELKQLIRVRRMEHPELPLLTPSQNYFLRQNLKLRLLAARLSLLQRDEPGFRNDLAVADKWLLTYYSARDPATRSLRENLAALAGLPVAQQAVELKESLAALRTLRGEAP